jgi:hypothetical protein
MWYDSPMHDEHHERRRFWSRVEQGPEGCWIWTGGTRANGYGTFAVKADGWRWTQTTAHRWAYMDAHGPLPVGWEVDHLCRVRGCVRLDHLEAVTIAENRRRRDTKFSPPWVDRNPSPLPVLPDLPLPRPRRDPEVECRNGHLYAETGWASNGSRRTCAACRAEAYERARVARNPGPKHGTETHCPHGHPYSPENTYVRKRGGRECRTCVRFRAKRKG